MLKIKQTVIIKFVICVFLCLPFLTLYAQYYKLAPAVRLPAGDEFMVWEDSTSYSKVYYVDCNNPKASDINDGSIASPFKSINKAAQILKPGEKVIVKEGVYRELIEPVRGGENHKKMICYEAAPGEQVIVKGSVVVDKGWEKSTLNKGSDAASIWMKSLDISEFNAYNPFLIENASNEDIAIMPWATEWAGKIPYTLGRGIVFQDSKRLIQKAYANELQNTPGSFWVDKENKKIHVHLFDNKGPNETLIELTVRQHVFKPKKTDLGYIRLKGFIIEQAGNGFPRTGVGAIFSMGGHHWIIEKNTVRHCNSVGIEIGNIYDETNRPWRTSESQREKMSPGHVIVRENEVYDCGTGGIQGLLNFSILVEKNYIHHCGWWDVELYWETGAIKLLLNRGSLVRQNIIKNINAAPGIWMDYDNINSRVTQNILVDIESTKGAIFIEASQMPNIVDRNFIWDIDGSGVYQHDCDELVVAHNFIANCTEQAVEMWKVPERIVRGRPSTCTKNIVVNNVFLNSAKGISFFNEDNQSNNNLFWNTGRDFDLKSWQSKRYDLDSKNLLIEASFSKETHVLDWFVADNAPLMPRINMCPSNFASVPYKREVPAGFLDYSKGEKTKVNLSKLWK